MLTITPVTRRYSGRAYLSASSRLWRLIPTFMRRLLLIRIYGAHLHSLVLRFQPRTQNHSTYFFRNRPELQLIRRLVYRLGQGAEVKIAVLGCSKGAEVYSIAYTVRTARPDLKLHISAIDISPEILAFAQAGIYSVDRMDRVELTENLADSKRDLTMVTFRDQWSISVFDRTSDTELDAMFDIADGQATVKGWLREGISWIRADVTDSQLLDTLGPQDFVIANRFLCHMEPPAAERCLRSIARLAKPGGYLFASGVDLDVRSKVAREMAWIPVTELLQEIYEGDPSLLDAWPLAYWASEPFQPERSDCAVRYAAAFQLWINACLLLTSIDWDSLDLLN
jgi:chemotaxis methyl-accepting protein methylase